MDIFTPDYFEKHITTVVPIVNVDLLVYNDKNEILLSWRNDKLFKGWHVPGRIIRYKESIEQAVFNCGWNELGWQPEYKELLETFETIRKEDIRGHFITFLYKCRLPEWYNVSTQVKEKGENGYLKWFSNFPSKMIKEQHRYKQYFK